MAIRGKCPICNSEKVKYVGAMKYIDLLNGWQGVAREYLQEILMCQECGMAWVKQPMDQCILDSYYKFLSKYEGAKQVGESDSSKKKQFERQYHFVNNTISDYNSVLEIGAATGENLNLYKEGGKKVIGIEPSKNNKVLAKSCFDIDLFDMTFDEWYEKKAENEQFDLIFMSHVLEHITNFSELIDKINNLTPKYCFIEVPFIESMGKQTEPFGMFTYEHVNYFSRYSIRELMYRKGWRLLKEKVAQNEEGEAPGYPTLVTLWEKDNNFEMLTRDVANNVDSILTQYLKKSDTEFQRIKDIIKKIPQNAKLAIYGTGAHTARLLAMTDLISKNIIKFYDSDRKKHGMTMCGKNIEEFNVNDILEGKIDTILISSYASEKSIEKFILSQITSSSISIVKLYF